VSDEISLPFGCRDRTGLPYQNSLDPYLLDRRCSAGLSPELWGPDDVCREAQHLSLLRQEAQETHHEVGRVTQPFAAAHLTNPSFRTERADFFFGIRSCECAGLRREKSLFLFGHYARPGLP
jgi:hypothetical protein